MTVPARRIERFVTWVMKNVDVVVAAGIALTIGLLDIFGDVLTDDVVSGATLLVLGALAIGSIVERVRQPTSIQEALAGTRQALEDQAMVRSLLGSEVASALRDARRDTHLWYFKGGTGTYLRAVTLPKCVESAKNQRSQLNIKIDIVNPADDRACAAYSRFRQMFAGERAAATAALWTRDRVKKEAYATVLAAACYRQQLATLEIAVHLSSVVSTLRFDLSETCLVITQDDPSRTNLLIRKGQPLYDYYVTELHQSREQATELDLRRAPHLAPEPTVDEVRALFDALGIGLPRSFTESDVGEIIVKALHAEDPYRR
ncbi:hypothetical protein GCM10010329_11890 [Streptomyces spiroverticillatus]|uniref:Uncharacterized protein n=1 Tax=Streptomyces finlayi TaxID=67296 RepID=A0A918WXE0_9ACTN|nr:hypothetical protein [Streptomyces finlayi]GGZ92741.1 hypothetical protein GCM10010329_11890 [Streptomyces spiroverticillatus]GHC92825.1 hypothetical protein GCM10010334_29210 [Streptomyces finlayi]